MNTSYSSSTDIPVIECINPYTNKYLIRWDFTPVTSNEKVVAYKFVEETINHKPTIDEVVLIITDYYNSLIRQSIIENFTYNETPVWLDETSQSNYKRAFDLAVQTQGSSLPVTFKFGTDEQPVYHTFTTLSEITDFYQQLDKFINSKLQEGWDIKDEIDWEKYRVLCAE